jgi:hypothetical protein
MRPAAEQAVEIEELPEEDEVSSDDFVVIIDCNGDLKGIIVPATLMSEPPPEVSKILQMYGIDDIHSIQVNTIH